MAIGTTSLVQKPNSNTGSLRNKVPAITNWTPILPYVIKNDNIAGLYFFKFILDIRLTDGSGELIGKLKQRKNSYPADAAANDGRAIFDVRDVINSQLDNTIIDPNSTNPTPIHKLGANVAADPFALNNKQILTIYIKGYQEYASTATASPDADDSTNVTQTNLYMNASLPLHTARGTGINFQDDAFDPYQMNASKGKFLSDVGQEYHATPNAQVYATYVQDTDYHTLAFLNGFTGSGASVLGFDSDIKYIYVKYYTAAGAEINSGTVKRLENNNSNGGCNPDIDSGGELNADNERLIYVGVGPANLEAQSEDTDARPSANAGWAYYKVYGENTAGNANTSQDYYFIKQDGSCKGFKVRRLAWVNSLGCWDYFNFKMKSSQTVDVNRNTYQTVMGEYNSDVYSYNNFDRGKRVRSTTATLKETINTDWITEDQANLMEKLLMSTNVQLVENADTDYTVPVMIIDKSIARKTSVNDGVKIQYTIQIEYAQPLNTNS
jgi:hypothetical protein